MAPSCERRHVSAADGNRHCVGACVLNARDDPGSALPMRPAAQVARSRNPGKRGASRPWSRPRPGVPSTWTRGDTQTTGATIRSSPLKPLWRSVVRTFSREGGRTQAMCPCRAEPRRVLAVRRPCAGGDTLDPTTGDVGLDQVSLSGRPPAIDEDRVAGDERCRR